MNVDFEDKLGVFGGNFQYANWVRMESLNLWLFMYPGHEVSQPMVAKRETKTDALLF
jgi:hypothetical protein